MPSLTWSTKALKIPAPVPLVTDSIVFPQGNGYPETPAPDRLILGDNLAAMAALLPEYEGRIDLIYADPPFFTNRRYRARVGRGEDSRKPQEWQMADGYPDHWEDLEAYLDMLYPRLALMHRLLSPTGTLYLHLDWHADAYARLLLDETFGAERLLNEIIWVYHGPSPIRTAFNRKHDTILAYTKSDDYTFNVDAVRQPYDPVTVKTFASSPKAGFGKIPDLERGKVPEDWWYFPVVARLHNERTGYPTQKPEALLERILLASSNPGELVADFFCGSGTTPVVAARTGRRFIAVDGAWRAVHTTYTRLVEAGAAPFTLQVEAQSAQISESEGKPLAAQQMGEISLKQEMLADLDYWEVDPAWDGQVFHSAAQAMRPRKKGPIRPQISLPLEQGGASWLARLVKIDGSRTRHRILR
jgi:DNA modification methylase